MKLLALSLFCTESKASDRVDPERALRRIEWAMDQVALALRKPESAPGKVLNDTGFCSVVLVGPNGAIVHVERFDEGYCAVITRDGDSVEVTDRTPNANAQACLAWLDRVARYCGWCMNVEKAVKANERPPVLESDLNLQHLHDWVGVKAVVALNAWKGQTFDRAATRAAKPAPSFEEVLAENVKNIDEFSK